MDTHTAARPSVSAPVVDRSTPVDARTQRWINVFVMFCVGTIVFSLATIVLPIIHTDFFNWVLYGAAEEPSFVSPEAREYLHLTFAIFSALTIGLMVLMIVVARNALGRANWAWWGLVGAVESWYVIDSVSSIAIGFGENVILNTVLLLGFAVPLLALRPRRSGAR